MHTLSLWAEAIYVESSLVITMEYADSTGPELVAAMQY